MTGGDTYRLIWCLKQKKRGGDSQRSTKKSAQGWGWWGEVIETLSSPKPHWYKQNHNAEHGSLICYKWDCRQMSSRPSSTPYANSVPRAQATPPLSQEILQFTGAWDTPGYNVKNFVNSIQSVASHGVAQVLLHLNLHPKAQCLAHSRCWASVHRVSCFRGKEYQRDSELSDREQKSSQVRDGRKRNRVRFPQRWMRRPPKQSVLIKKAVSVLTVNSTGWCLSLKLLWAFFFFFIF